MSNKSPDFTRSHEQLSRHHCKVLMIDVQVKLLQAIPVSDQLVFNCSRLLRAAQILGVPVVGTEQYPQGLGPTVPELAQFLKMPPPKTRFSCAETLAWEPAAQQADGRFQVLVIGMEAHVCVQQTVLDLLSLGYMIYVAADAVASRGKLDWKISLNRMANSGAVVTTTESALFEWCETSSSPEFKEISQIVRETPPSV